MAGKLTQHRANKDYTGICGDAIRKGEQYWSLTAFRQQARYCINHRPDAATVRRFGGLSRADRASDCADGLRDVANAYRSLADGIRVYLDNDRFAQGMADDERDAELARIKAQFDELPDSDCSEIDDLAQELGDWRDNMQGTGLENTAKFEEVSDTAGTLESIDTDPDTPSWDGDNLSSTADDLETCAEALEDIADELESIDYPGMY